MSVGGGTRNLVWSQATSDMSGKTQLIAGKTIGASYGDAALAALGVGDASRRTIETWNPVSHEIRPEAVPPMSGNTASSASSTSRPRPDGRIGLRPQLILEIII